MRLTDLTRESVQAFLTRKLESGLAWKTVKHLRTALGSIVGRAEQWGYVEHNVVRKTLLPRRVSQQERRQLTVGDLKKLIHGLPEPSRTIVSVLVRTGLRIGELLALRWKDVDFRSRQIHVERTVYEGKFDEPKTTSSRRSVPLSPAATQLLKARRSKLSGSDELVFASCVGTPLSRRNLLQRQLQPTARKLGLTDVTWHSFRHVNATLLDSVHISEPSRSCSDTLRDRLRGVCTCTPSRRKREALLQSWIACSAR